MSLDRNARPDHAGRRLRVLEILDGLAADDAETLRLWLADLSYSPEFIRRELMSEGITVSTGALCRYRRNVLKIGDRKR